MVPDRTFNTLEFDAFYRAWGPHRYKLAAPGVGLSRIPSGETDGLSAPGVLYGVFFQRVFKPVMPLFGQWWDATQPWFIGPHVCRYLFLLKSWYLIFDLGIAFLLLRLIVDNQKRLLAFKLWMTNPVVILVCYMHGQYDIVPTFFVALSLYYVAVGKSRRSLFHLQWFVWVIPLLILFCVENRKVSTLYWLQIVCVFVYTFYWGRYLLDLFAPLDPFFFAHLKGPYEIINQYYSAPKFIRIFRSIFSGICLWMTYLILRQFFFTKKEELR